MKVFATIITALFLSQLAFAQIPLSKRDQAKKAEFEAQIASEKKYEELMAKADQAFVDKDYVKARMTYSEAVDYNKEKEQWLISKVNDLDILMAKIIMREIDSMVVIEPKNVGQLQEIARPETEISSRNEAMEIITPSVEIATIELEPVAEIAANPVVELEPVPVVEEVRVKDPIRNVDPEPKRKSAVIAPTVKKDVKVKEDFSRYPQGRSDETFTFPDHSVRRIIIKDGIDTIIYKYVTHRWGGKFYFKDDVSISERIWKEEILGFEKKYPTVSKLD